MTNDFTNKFDKVSIYEIISEISNKYKEYSINLEENKLHLSIKNIFGKFKTKDITNDSKNKEKIIYFLSKVKIKWNNIDSEKYYYNNFKLLKYNDGYKLFINNLFIAKLFKISNNWIL
jgi:hypothetical protein